MEKSGNLRKDLKSNINESVSTLRKAFILIYEYKQLDNVKEEYNSYRKEIKNTMKEEGSGGITQTDGQVAASIDYTLQAQNNNIQQADPPIGGRRRKLFSEVVKNQDNNKRYKITLKPKETTTTPEQIKSQLKNSINPTEIKVGIKAVKTIRDRCLIIETESEEESNILFTEIRKKLGEKMDIYQNKLRNPRVIIYSVPEETTVDNIGATIMAQNPEIITNDETIEAKFRFKNKRGHYNIVMEVGPQTRKQILQAKLKIGWNICKAADYLVPTRCFKCRFNHKHYKCKGEDTCPHCTGTHKMKECTATISEQKCINCIAYNKYSKEGKINENHSAMSKDCPSLQAVLKRYRENVQY